MFYICVDKNKKVMNITQAIIAAVLLLPAQIQAADTLQTTVAAKPASWTLRSCIDYAKQNNVTVRKNKVNAQSARLDLANAKAGRLPTVSASTSQQGSYAPFRKTSAVVNGSQVMSTGSKWTYSGNYGLEASMPVFDGGTTKNNIKLAEINTQIADLTADASMLTIEEQITNLYVQILYAKETVNEDEEQIKLSETNLARTQEFYRNGLLAQADVSQIESQLATDRYQKVADETTLNQYRLQLKQLLEISDDENFDIATTSIDGDVLAMLPATSQVYNTALALRPEIQAGKLAMQKSDLDVKIAKAAWYPTVRLNAGLNATNMSGNGNLMTQLKQNWNNFVSVSVSIPIYDGGKTKNNIAKARLEKQSYYLDLLETQKSLWNTIDTYRMNAYNAQQRYVAAKENANYARTSYELTSEQYRLGLKNILELTTGKTNLATANQKMLQAKYTELLNAAMLKYYMGDTINL